MAARLGFLVCTIVLLSVLSAPILAQEHTANAGVPPPQGVSIHATLKTDLSTKYSKVGDPIELDIGHALTTFNGRDPQVLLGEHTRLLGKVTMVRRAGHGQTGAVAVRIVEARSKDQTQPLNVALINPVLVMREVAGSPVGSHGPGTVIPNGMDKSSDGEVTINQDSALGDVLTSKHNFFLIKNETELTVVLR